MGKVVVFEGDTETRYRGVEFSPFTVAELKGLQVLEILKIEKDYAQSLWISAVVRIIVWIVVNKNIKDNRGCLNGLKVIPLPPPTIKFLYNM